MPAVGNCGLQGRKASFKELSNCSFRRSDYPPKLHLCIFPAVSTPCCRRWTAHRPWPCRPVGGVSIHHQEDLQRNSLLLVPGVILRFSCSYVLFWGNVRKCGPPVSQVMEDNRKHKARSGFPLSKRAWEGSASQLWINSHFLYFGNWDFSSGK